MNATERAALIQGLEFYDEMTGTVGARTLEILDRRRRTAVVHRRGWLVRRMLVVADIAGLLVAFVLVESLARRHGSLGAVDSHSEILAFVASIPAWLVVAKLYGLYDRDEERTDHSTADDFVGVFHMVTVCTWLFWASAYLTGLVHPTPARLVAFWFAAVCFISLARGCARAAARRNITYVQNAVIVGAGDVGQLIAKKFLQHPEYGINIVGFVDSKPTSRSRELEHVALLGGTERLPALVRLFDVERVLIAFSNDSHAETLDVIRSLRDLDVQIEIVPRLFEIVGPRVGINTVEGIPILTLPPLRLSMLALALKRSLDIAVGLTTIILLQPLLWLIALIIKFDSRGPVFYRDERIGRGGAIFRAVKFRTMRDEAMGLLDSLLVDPAARAEFDRTHKLRNDPRITRVGRFLRHTSLDELPQLLNVIRGDVSLVGPRPITRYEYERRGLSDGRTGVPVTRYWESDMRPGLTGYWQINGRSLTDYQDRVRLDTAYVTNWSMRLDLEILAKTVRVLVGRGAV